MKLDRVMAGVNYPLNPHEARRRFEASISHGMIIKQKHIKSWIEKKNLIGSIGKVQVICKAICMLSRYTKPKLLQREGIMQVMANSIVKRVIAIYVKVIHGLPVGNCVRQNACMGGR